MPGRRPGAGVALRSCSVSPSSVSPTSVSPFLRVMPFPPSPPFTPTSQYRRTWRTFHPAENADILDVS